MPEKSAQGLGISREHCWDYSLFHMKITVSATKSSHQDHGPCYLHLPIFFLYIHSPVLLQNKKFLCRPSQIACAVTTMNVLARKRHYAYTKIHVRYWFLYVKIIWIYQFVRLFCPVLGWFYHVLLPVRAINCENCQNWCYQSVTIENYFSSPNTDLYDLRK